MLVKTRDYEQEAIHKLVDVFATKMGERLDFLYERGARGWDDENEDYDYMARIDYHLDAYERTGNPTHLIDVANLVMFVYNKEIV
jgi:hypothetical protein